MIQTTVSYCSGYRICCHIGFVTLRWSLSFFWFLIPFVVLVSGFWVWGFLDIFVFLFLCVLIFCGSLVSGWFGSFWKRTVFLRVGELNGYWVLWFDSLSAIHLCSQSVLSEFG
ncbi:hypothetical protein EX30DRAFT_143413 [Ascodesmis nigricans]|uniref:Uncharacterized protein n=1 Tax=Ascodesmis nigricans TaxID=341454 RepID=A0A4S2N1E8_9PEZI|nr:hypothetical protein EX30DRAFT_143413 [Ascodesmis nigricans]